MPNANQFLPWAIAAGANVRSPSAYAALVARQQGAQAGDLPSLDYNTPLRQATSIISMIAQFMADRGPGDVLDNGDIGALEAQFIAALTSLVTSIIGPDFLFVGTDSGTADNVHVTTMSPAVTAYANNQFYLVTIAAENASNSPQFQIGSLGYIPIKLSDGTACPAGYLQAGARALFANVSGTSVELVGGYRSQIPEMNGVVVAETTNWGPVPAGVVGLEDIWAFGAGGGGAGATGPSQWAFGGAGGGACWKAFLPCNPGDMILMEVGAGGLASAAGSPGANGGDTIIHGSSTLSALGGTGGTASSLSGSTGGDASGGDLNRIGENGAAGVVVIDGSGAQMAIGGTGGGVPFGGNRSRLVFAGAPGRDGAQGEYPGGGGGGAATSNGVSSQMGGNGADGLILFKYRTATV